MNRSWKIQFSGDITGGGICTWFGGNDDPQDDGSTASGLNTKNNPTIRGCALPIPTCAATEGSPLPLLPYIKTMVQITADNGKQVTVPLIDVGPALDTNHAIDVTQQTFRDLGGDLSAGLLSVQYRILTAGVFL